MQDIDIVWVVKRLDRNQHWNGIVNICKSLFESLVYAHRKAWEVSDGADVDFGQTEQLYPVHEPEDSPSMHPCEYVVVGNCIWYIHQVPL